MDQQDMSMGQPLQSKTVGTGEWVLTLFLTFIPLVNLIMLLIWAFSSGTAPSKKNWARANLIWMLIAFVLFLIMFMIGAIGAASMGGY